MFMGVLNVLLAGYGFHNPITYTCTGLYIAIDTKGFIGGRGGGEAMIKLKINVSSKILHYFCSLFTH